MTTEGRPASGALRVLSLFSGVGAIDLGLERAGMTTVGLVERDPMCQAVLARHFPAVPLHDDVTTCIDWWQGQERPNVDVVAGGFPCQPFSTAGRRRGVADDRWLWPAMAAVIGAVRPRYVVVENVPALLRDADAFGWLLGDLADLGFDAEWSLLSACAMGAPHTRERLFLMAYSDVQHGSPRLGLGASRSGSLRRDDHREGPWADPVDGLLEAANRRDRVANGDAVRLVAAGGNAVVVPCLEYVGRLIVEHAATASTAVAS